MVDATQDDWRRKRLRIAGLTALVLIVELLGLSAGISAVVMDLVRVGYVFVAGLMGIGTPAGRKRLMLAFAALEVLEIVLLVAGAYAGLVWVLRIFLYPQALLFATPRKGEVRFAWVWAGLLGAMLIAFLVEKGALSGKPAFAWGSRLVAAGAVAALFIFARRTFAVLTSLKFAAISLTLLTVLCILGTLIVQRPPISPEQYPNMFAKGQVGFVVNAEALLGLVKVPKRLQLSPGQRKHVLDLREAFGDQPARQWKQMLAEQDKRDFVATETKTRITEHDADVIRLRDFLDAIFFTRMFKSFAFNILLILLAISLVMVIAKKYPWGKYEWGPVVTHAGIVVILLGCAISDLSLKHGFVQMRPAGPDSVVGGFYDQRGGFAGDVAPGNLGPEVTAIRDRLGGSGAADFSSPEGSASVEFRPAGESWTARGKSGRRVSGQAARKAVASWKDVSYRAVPYQKLPFRVRMTAGVVDYYRELMVTAPKLGDPMQPVEQSYPLRAGKTIPLFHGRYVVKILDVEDHVRVVAGAGTNPIRRDIPAKVGTRQTVSGPGGNYEVEVLGIAGNWGQANNGEPLAKQNTSNPAVHLRVKAPSGEEETVWAFERYPEFYRQGAMGKRNAKVGVSDIGFEFSKRIVTLSFPGKGSGLLTRKDFTPVKVAQDQVPARDLEPVIHIALTEQDGKGGRRTVKRWLRLAQRERQGQNGPVRSTVRPRDDPQAWLSSADGQIRMRLFETSEQSMYETHVDLLDAGDPGVIEKWVIRVNHPLVYRGYRFYQSNYMEDGGLPISGLTVKYDVAIPLIYAGFLICMIGLVFALYVLPPLRRKAEARAREEFGATIRMGMEF